MSRHKKTRQQKIRADLRAGNFSAPLSSATNIAQTANTFSLSQAFVAKHPNPTLALEHKYIFEDVKKTLFLTSLILLSQLILLFLLKNHLVRLPMITGLY